MSRASLQTILQALDERILTDPSVGPALFAHLREQERSLGLLHADRPTCPFLRPLILGRTQYESIAGAARTIAEAFERLVECALQDQSLLSRLGLTAAEERMARIDPGYERLCVTSRLDTYLHDDDFHFLEYNAENPAGVGDQMQLEKVLFAGIALGWETSAEDWEHAIEVALERPYVVQQRVPVEKTPFPTFVETASARPMIVDFNPFLFDNHVEGALVRLSTTSLRNISSGGGQTALLVLED
jgi:hypothetical protein